MKSRARLTGVIVLLLSAALLLGSLSVCLAAGSKKNYAIVVSRATYADSDWAKVVNALKAKYKGKVFVYDFPNVGGIRKQLSSYMPWYVCVVAKPEEAERELLRDAADTIRRLDNDPYEDSIWAVLTGYDAADALRIATADNMTITQALSGVTRGWLDWFDSGIAYSETNEGGKTVKESGKAPEDIQGPSDTTESIVKDLNSNKYQIMSSSGHASESNWSMGYSYKNGYIVCHKGKLYGISSTGDMYEINTTNPKIYFSPGNCLIGHIPGQDCMALAWIHNGANQFFGHIVPQGRPCWAWSIVEYYFELQDRYSFSEANYIYTQTLSFEENELQHSYPCCYNEGKGTGFYGDPAWDARLKKVATPLYDQEVSVKKLPKSNKYKINFTITMNTDGSMMNHPFAFLPMRIKNWTIDSTDAKKVVVTDNFIIMQVLGEGDQALKKGDKRTVELTAEPCKKWVYTENTAAN